MKQLINKEITDNNGQAILIYRIQNTDKTEFIIKCGDLTIKKSLTDI